MSGSAPVFRPAGQTVALSVVATAHAAVPLTIAGNDMANYVALLNTGTVTVAVRLSAAGVAATLPVDGTPGDWILGPSQQHPELIPLPAISTTGAACQITAIGATAGPSVIYCTPVTMQT